MATITLQMKIYSDISYFCIYQKKDEPEFSLGSSFVLFKPFIHS